MNKETEVIRKKNKAGDRLIEWHIPDVHSFKYEDIALDRIVCDSKTDQQVAAELFREEYECTLKNADADAIFDNEIIYSTGLKYCLPEKDDEPEVHVCPQEKSKVIHWLFMLCEEKEETDVTVEIFAFFRDQSGNIFRLHPSDNKVDLHLIKDSEASEYFILNISREDGQPLDCGRYYIAFRVCKQKECSPFIFSFLNIVPPKGSLEPVRSELVGLEKVYQQMERIAKQKMFNDNRIAMNLAPTPINLHAAVMGNKGTGKTSFAHILYDFYKKNGLVTEGRLHVVDGSRWVNMSEDTHTIEEDFENADKGMLFVENAASMIPLDFRGNKKYAVQALVRLLKDRSKNTCLVLADTPERITELLATADLRIYIGQIYQLPNLDLDQMMEVAQRECRDRGFVLTPGAMEAMRTCLASQVDATTTDVSLLIDRMIMNMSERVMNGTQELFQKTEALSELLAEDVPQIHIGQYDQSVSKLNNLVGLKNLKYSIESHLNLVRFAQLRSRNGLPASMPPLHMIFTGNPGTGKTTVANLLGEIYASLGILKTGKVISVDRKKLVGQYIGDTEENTKRALQQAHGNILLIDEAYTLVADPNDKKDFGSKVIDCLLEELGKEKTDMIIILAGYPDEMEKLLDYNKGLRSRFPYTFHFEDYSEDELIEIAKRTVEQSGYVFSEEAIERLRALIRRERERSHKKDQAHFGNARFITRLISTKILRNMGRRVLEAASAENTKAFLSTIEAVDIPASVDDEEFTIDEGLINSALGQLDRMAGLKDVKQTLHNLVNLARSRQNSGEDLLETIPLQWTFTGATGTGKSSVARILAQILHGLHLISSERMTQLRMPQSASNVWTPYDIDQTLRDTMKQAGQGLLFIDLDDFANSHIDVQWLRCKLTSLTAEMPGSHAFVIAVDDRRMTTQPIEMPISTSILHFEDYTADELMTILRQKLDKHAFRLADDAAEELFGHIRNLCNNRSCGFANARTMRHIYTAITSAAELRTMSAERPGTPIEITKEDVQSFRWKPLNSNRIGYGA